jgi:hypothetical protein
MTSITGRVTLMMVLVVVLATAACGKGSQNLGPGGSGGTGGGDISDGSTDDGGDRSPCPQPFADGDSCAVENLACTPPRECRRCVGGFRLMPLASWSMCICHAGRWGCLPPPLTGTVIDCFVDQPLACKDAKDLYLDPACTEPAPCSP